ncbi:MAG: hypothetical protein Sapg2KO_07150 [Saprospiraceae bacterium]
MRNQTISVIKSNKDLKKVKMKSQYSILIFVSLALFSACSSSKIISDIGQGIDFTQYKTYTWSTVEDPINRNFPQYDNSLNRERWKNSIDVAMQNQGYILAEEKADLEVDFHLQFEHNVVPSRSHEDDWENTSVDLKPSYSYQYDRGIVTIHLVDLKKNQIIWQGLATKVIDLRVLEEAEANIQKVVDKIFKKLALQITS